MKKLILFIIPLVVFGVIACKKYEDDSFISLKTPQKRLLGKWHLVEFTVDGVDSLAQYVHGTYYMGCENLNYYKEDGDKKFEICSHTYVENWVDGGTLDIPIDLVTAQDTDPNRIQYSIIKLYKNDFWFKYIRVGKKYIFKFKKIS